MYSTHDEGKSVVDERFIKKLKNKAFKHMAAAEYNENSNEKDPRFKVGGLLRISKYKNIFV